MRTDSDRQANVSLELTHPTNHFIVSAGDDRIDRQALYTIHHHLNIRTHCLSPGISFTYIPSPLPDLLEGQRQAAALDQSDAWLGLR